MSVVVMMADESDDCRDVVRYWQILGQGWDAVFGSRFVRGGGVMDTVVKSAPPNMPAQDLPILPAR